MPPEIRTVLLVARREFLTRVRSRVWLIGTVALVLGMSGYIVLQAKVISPSVAQTKVAFEGPAQALQPGVTAIATSLGVKLQVRQVASPADGAAKVDGGSLDALVGGDPAHPVVTVKEKLSPELAAAIGSAAKQVALNQALLARGVDPAAVDAAVAAAGPTVHLLDAGAAQRAERDVAGIVVAILLYVSLLIYGQVVAAGVVEEKANRIVEILLSTIRARQLLIGKVLGIGLLGLIQLALVGAVALFVSSRMQVITIPTLGVSAVAGGLLWFVLGFILYSLLYAAGASLVSRQEDLAAVTAPISVLVVGTYLAFFWVIANPTSPTAVTLSLLPPFAPVLMPARMATGDASLWQVAVAVGLAIAAIGGLNWLAGRIYANSVLRLGSRVRLRQAWAGRS
jgi:ABC-2 type transport system permease protein